LADIKPAPYNPRVQLTAKDQEYKALDASISENGLVLPLVVNLRDNCLIGGHQRLSVLLAAGETETVAVVVDMPEAQAKALCIALNKLDGEWDYGQLADILQELIDDGENLLSTGFTQSDIDDLLGEIGDELGERFIKPETLIVDVGCSTGLAVEPFVTKYGEVNDFLLIDNAPAMAAACRDRFQDEPRVSVQEGNLWSFLPLKKGASLVLSVLSMQFMPTAYRPSMLRMIYDGLEPGGALIFVEKILSESMDDLMVELYYEMKRENGYTEEQIAAKRRSLENVLSPLKAEWNADLLRTAGFRKVDMFWRCLNFCGWIAVK
jgi:tRNA (cmo5U34)-methyltransferase